MGPACHALAACDAETQTGSFIRTMSPRQSCKLRNVTQLRTDTFQTCCLPDTKAAHLRIPSPLIYSVNDDVINSCTHSLSQSRRSGL